MLPRYGLVYNGLTGYVDTSVAYAGGLHLIGPTKSFIRFPANHVKMEFSERPGATTTPVDARTGPDQTDADSGGQPVRLSVSILYSLSAPQLGNIYKSFSVNYEMRYAQYLRQTISDVAQRFDPTQFWKERYGVVLQVPNVVAHSFH